MNGSRCASVQTALGNGSGSVSKARGRRTSFSIIDHNSFKKELPFIILSQLLHNGEQNLFDRAAACVYECIRILPRVYVNVSKFCVRCTKSFARMFYMCARVCVCVCLGGGRAHARMRACMHTCFLLPQRRSLFNISTRKWALTLSPTSVSSLPDCKVPEAFAITPLVCSSYPHLVALARVSSSFEFLKHCAPHFANRAIALLVSHWFFRVRFLLKSP